MVHDHDMYCQRSSRYFPWNRTVCTRKAGYGCLLRCALVRTKSGPLPVRLAWPAVKLHEMELCRQFSTFVVQTEYMKAELLLHDFDETRIHILPAAPQQQIAALKEDYHSPQILFVGQILRGKGLDFLLRALAQLGDRPWQCTIAGEGSHRSTCETLCREL